MNRKIIIIVAFILMSLCVCAETPEECYKKHGDRLCVFVKPTPRESEIKDFNIERMVIDKSATHAFIKTLQQSDEIVYEIENIRRGGSFLMVATLKGGALLTVDSDFDISFFNEEGKGAIFVYDQDRTLEYRRISKGE